MSHLEALVAAAVFSDSLPFAFPTLLLYVAFELPSSEVKLEGEMEDALRLEDAAAADCRVVVVAGEAICLASRPCKMGMCSMEKQNKKMKQN